jgi:hypothetical protein
MTLLSDNLNSPHKIWDWVLSSLQTDLSKAMFETWVKPAKPVSFENGIFTLGCHNQYAIDWLSSRLKTLVERQLSGALGQPVKLAFVLLDLLPVDRDGDNSESVEESQSSTSQESLSEYEPVYASLRDAMLQPDRVVRMPVYFLRWLPYVGARTIFEVIGLWQEYYLASRGKQPKGGEKVGTRIENVGQWAGVSRAQLFRDLTPGAPLSWFMNKIETDHERDRSTGRSKKSANKYALYGIPLTPGDAEDLSGYLKGLDIRGNPQLALRKAIAAQPNQILQFPYRSPAENFRNITPHRVTVQDVVREAIGKRLDSELSDLADQLADQLLAPGDFILIRWYFLQNWLPLLGPNAAMMVVLLRNLSYYNDETGEIRNEVWVEGGNTALAARLGIDHPRQVALWFPAALERGSHKDTLTSATSQENARRLRVQDTVASFVKRIEYRSTGSDYDWLFKVQRMDPLIPEHERIKQAVFNLLISLQDEEVLEEFYCYLDEMPNDCFETLKNDSMIVLRLSKCANDCSETLEMVLNDWIETVKDLPNDCFETLLKILKSFKDSQKDKDSSPNQNSSGFRKSLPNLVGDGTDQNRIWETDHLLRRVNPRVREALIAQERGSIPLVSWILYGVANATIQNPLSLAISKLTDQPGITAGGAYDRLAALSPAVFANLFSESLTWQGNSNQDWRTAFKGIDRERLMLLADLLDLAMDSGNDA